MPPEPCERTTLLLGQLVDGDSAAAEQLVPVLYDQLRAIARRLLVDQSNATLQPTELIHEAYVRLVDDDGRGEAYEGRRHFQRVAARAMRYVLVDRARARHAEKRGSGRRPATLDEALAGDPMDGEQVLMVHDALEVLGGFDAQLGQIVELPFFGGLTMDEVAAALDISRRTAQRGWRLARAWWLEEYTKVDHG